MVRLTLGLLGLAASVTAAPTSSATEIFSMEAWVERMIADPNGPHLSPEEAIQTRNAAIEARAWNQLNPLRPRANCQAGFKDANATDAAQCLKILTDKGNAGVQCVIGNNQFDISMCRIGNADIHPSKSERTAQGANCRDIARAGGLIFDGCFRSDNTVKGSEICPANRLIQVNIVGV